jgi:indole-3-acetate monooxygenase
MRLHPALVDTVRSLQPDIERNRRLPAELVDEFRSAGLFAMGIPASLGGGEASLTDMVRSIEEISRADGSAGWCVMIAATSGITAAYIDPAEAREIFSGDTIACGVVAPKGRALPVDGGYRISGRWSFASGCQHSDVVLAGCVMDRSARMAVLDPAVVEIVDTWDVSGLRGTGSHDITAHDAFVPSARTFSLVTDRPAESGPLYRFPIFGLLALGVASVGLGIAARAIEEIVELAGGKRPTLARRTLAERSVVQAEVARAEALYRSARAYLFASIDEAWDSGELDVAARANLRLAATNAARASAQAVDICYDAGGGTSIYAGSALQRCFRDIHALTQHMIVAPTTYELVGRLALGLDTDTSML